LCGPQWGWQACAHQKGFRIGIGIHITDSGGRHETGGGQHRAQRHVFARRNLSLALSSRTLAMALARYSAASLLLITSRVAAFIFGSL
jgi:hypothetical protein